MDCFNREVGGTKLVKPFQPSWYFWGKATTGGGGGVRPQYIQVPERPLTEKVCTLFGKERSPPSMMTL